MQRHPVIIGHETLYLYAVNDYVLLYNKRNDKFCAGALFSDEKSKVQLFIASMRPDVVEIRRLMDEVVDVVFERQPINSEISID